MTPRRALRWFVSAVVVVGVIVAIRLTSGNDTVEREGLTFASKSLALALERNAAGPDVRVIMAFEDSERVPCRAFVAAGVSGIACHERGGWHLRIIRGGVALDDPATVSATEQALREAASQMGAQ